ncbi:hypothetical protein [Sphingomonas sp.]|uniref:hypothetical protein n=1 Tax=Sphingomonas sp. TaxID=28214 RepID=UPI002D0E83CA|nr:hypothetical protein [Sphingomonas sp.]HWK37081.1 hypothetical protein [Sphingomonas sp.]
MRLVFSAVVLAAVSCSVPAYADDGKSAATADKKICRREVATGSVMAKVTCHTKAEWDAITARGQNDLDRSQSQARSRDMIGSTRELTK